MPCPRVVPVRSILQRRVQRRARGRFGAFVLFAFGLCAQLSCAADPIPRDAVAAAGVLDLRGTDLRHAVVNLSGEYEFYWRRFLTPRSGASANHLVDYPVGPDTYVAVPGAWNSVVLAEHAPDQSHENTEPIGAEGYATYRLKILWDPIARPGLRVPTMHTAFRLFVNGVEVCSNGQPGVSRETSAAGYGQGVVEIPFESGTDQVPKSLELLLHVSNFQHRKGGTWANIQLGPVDLLRGQRERTLLFDFFLVGSFLIMGLYHVGLFLMRSADRSPLYFGLFCLLVTLRLLTTGEHYFLVMFPGIDWEWYIRIQYWAVYFAVPTFAAFVYHAFPQEFHVSLLWGTWVIAAAHSAFVLFTPVSVFSWSMAVFQFFLALAGLLVLAILLLSLLHGRHGAWLYFIGWVFFFGAVLNDVLNTNEVIRTGYAVPFGLFLFIAMQAIFLASRFSRAYKIAEDLSESLEDGIRERTRELMESRDELRTAKEIAERSDRAKSEFLATMSHEIRTPLNSILGAASLLDESPLSGEQKQHLSILNRAGNRLLTLINEILDLSKIEAGKLSLEATPFRVRDVCLDLEGLMGNRAALKGITLTSSYAPDVPEACVGDGNRLAQVLLNLIGNAIKFTERGGVDLRVELSPKDVAETRAENISLRFSVTDTGIGIAPDKQQRIFESFVQAEQSDDRRYEGTGLGLTISRRLVELMGGQLQLISEPGVGSTFWFDASFTAVAPGSGDVGEAAVTSGAAPTRKSSPSGILKILLADDNPDNRYLMQVFLNKTEADLQTVENGREALDRACAERFDLILMDIQMPVMDGYEAVRAIREWETAHSQKPAMILALTADATRDAYHKAMSAGCNGYLTKPIQKQALLEAIAEYTN